MMVSLLTYQLRERGVTDGSEVFDLSHQRMEGPLPEVVKAAGGVD